MREDLLKRHLELVIEANKTTNITRISTWDEGMLLHVQDSLVGLPELREAPEGRMVDIGSGAGYPGIPLAIESGRSTLLADSVGKKTTILASMVQTLGLDNVDVYTGRIEDLAREEPASFAAVTARVKIFWPLPIITALFFLLGTWLFFSMGEKAFILYALGYLLLGIVAELISMFVKKKHLRS